MKIALASFMILCVQGLTIYRDLGAIKKPVEKVYFSERVVPFLTKLPLPCIAEEEYFKLENRTVMSQSGVHLMLRNLQKVFSRAKSLNKTSSEFEDQSFSNLEHLHASLKELLALLSVKSKYTLAKYHDLINQHQSLDGVLNERTCKVTISDDPLLIQDEWFLRSITSLSRAKRSMITNNYHNVVHQHYDMPLALRNRFDSSGVHSLKTSGVNDPEIFKGKSDHFKDQTDTHRNKNHYRGLKTSPTTSRPNRERENTAPMTSDDHNNYFQDNLTQTHIRQDISSNPFSQLGFNTSPTSLFADDPSASNPHAHNPTIYIKCSIRRDGSLECQAYEDVRTNRGIFPTVVSESIIIPRCERLRKRRAVFAGWGKMGKWWAGYLTEDDMKMIQEQMGFLWRQNNLTATQLKLQSEQLVLLTNKVESDVEKIYDDMNKGYAEVSRHIHILEANIAHLAVEIETAQSHILLMEQVLYISAYLQQLIIEWDNFLDKLKDMETYTIRLRNSYLTGKVDPDVFSIASLRKIFKRVKDSLEPNMMIPDESALRTWYQGGNIAIISDQLSIWVAGHVPIIPKQNIETVSLIRALPIKLSERWVKLSLDGNVIVSLGEKKPWALLPLDDYNLCLASTFQICPVLPAWRSYNSNECIVSLIENKLDGIGGCELETLKTAPLFYSYALPVPPRHWFITASETIKEYTLTCMTSTGEVTMNTYPSSKALLIDTNDNCLIELDNLELYPPYPQNASSLSITNEYDKEVMIQSVQTPSLKEPAILPFHRNLSLAKKLPTLNSTQRVFKNDRSQYREIVNKIKDDNIVYIDEIDQLNKEIEKLKEGAEGDYNPFDPWYIKFVKSLSWIHIIFIVTHVVTILLIILLFISMRQTGGGALAGAQLLPGGYAFKIVTTKLPTSTTTTVRSIVNSSIVLEGQSPMSDNSSIHPVWYPIISCSIMLLVMIYLHWRSEQRATRRSRYVESICGLLPKNQFCHHNLGETQVMVYFLVRIKSVWCNRRQTFELGAQIATIPDSPRNWSLLIKNGRMDLLDNKEFYRYQSRLSVKLSWGNVCLHYRKAPDMDSCNDMPNKLVIGVSDLIDQCGHSLPTFWWSGEIISVTKVYLKNHSYTQEVYSYIDDIELA